MGVDASARQIEEARRIASDAGLSNVTFVRSRFDEMELDEGSFDYVICHGVLSWVSARDRARLLERIAGALRGHGIAYVSLNALPGWYDRLAARDWLRFSTASLGRPVEEAGASLAWLGTQMQPRRRTRSAASTPWPVDSKRPGRPTRFTSTSPRSTTRCSSAPFSRRLRRSGSRI